MKSTRRAGARLRAGGPAQGPAGLPGAPAAGERRQLLLREPAGRRVGRHGRAAGVAAVAGARGRRCRCRPRSTARRRRAATATASTWRSSRCARRCCDACAATTVPAACRSSMPSRAADAVAASRGQLPRLDAHAGRAARRRRCAAPPTRSTPRLPRFCALLVKEAFKTWGDAVAEVREAVDFLRYYADEAERVMQPVALPGPTGESNELRLTGRGPWVCISPWNFPLAIFAGQVAAALATGNTVLAKPAEQTPAVALGSGRAAARGRRAAPMRCSCCTARAKPSAPRWWRRPAWPAWCSPARRRSRRSSTARWPPRTARSCR